MKRLFVLLLVCLVPSVCFAQEVFYACSTGDGSNPKSGVAAEAYDEVDLTSAAKYTSTISASDGLIGPGDFVYLMDDCGDFSVISINDQNGTAGYQITYMADPTNSGDVTIDGGASSQALFIDDRSYITWDGAGIILSGGTVAAIRGTWNGGSVYRGVKLNNFTIETNIVRGMQIQVTTDSTLAFPEFNGNNIISPSNNCFSIWAGDETAGEYGTLAGVDILNNYCYRAGNSGISVIPGSHADVIRNEDGWNIWWVEIINNTIIEPAMNGIVLQTSGTHPSRIANNTINTPGYGETGLAIGIRLAASSHVTIEDNEVWGTLSSGAGDGNAITTDGFCDTVDATLTGTCTFTDTSTTVTCAGGDIQNEVCPRAYVRMSSETTYYEIKSLDSATQLTLVTAYSGTGGADTLNSTPIASWSDNAIIRRNYLHDNIDASGAGISSASCKDCIIHNNLIVNNKRGIYGRMDYASGNKIYNNTIIDTTGDCIDLYQNAPAYEIRGNILSGCGAYGIDEDATDPDSDYNLFWNYTTGTVDGFTIGSNSIDASADPLNNSYRLKYGSEAMDASTLVNVMVDGWLDYFGCPRLCGEGPDIGADEFCRSSMPIMPFILVGQDSKTASWYSLGAGYGYGVYGTETYGD